MKSLVSRIILCLATIGLLSVSVVSQSKCICRPSPPGGVTICNRDQIAVCGGTESGACEGHCVDTDKKGNDPVGLAARLLTAILGKKLAATNLRRDKTTYLPIVNALLESGDKNGTVTVEYKDKKFAFSIWLPDEAKLELKKAAVSLDNNKPWGVIPR